MLDHGATEDEDTLGRAMGREVHRLILEPDSEPDYVIWEGGDRRGKAWKEFEAANFGKTIFKPNEVAHCNKMAEAVASHPAAKSLLKGCAFEYVLEWRDPQTGLACKGRLDAVKPGVLIDIKSCASIGPRQFARTAAEMGYHLQLAHYSNGIKAIRGYFPAKIYIIAVEVRPPYDVAVYEIGPEPMEIAQMELAYTMKLLKTCIDRQEWPGIASEPQTLAFPGYIFGEGEVTIK